VVRLSRQHAALRHRGPMIAIGVGPSSAAMAAYARAGRRPPSPVPVLAIIDTGSGRSILQHDLAVELQLTPVGAVEIDTPSTVDMSVMEYFARFWLDRTTSVELKVLEAPLRLPRVRALVGRDLLAYGHFSYDGPRNEFTLEVPRGAHPTSPDEEV
jgi:hypothetical protein